MPKYFVNISHIIPPDADSIYTEDKFHRVFLFNRTEKYKNYQHAQKRLGQLNKELSDHCQELAEISGQLYMTYCKVSLSTNQKLSRLSISFTEFQNILNAIGHRSTWPEGGFLSFLNFYNAADVLHNIVDEMIKNPQSHIRYEIRKSKRQLEKLLKNVRQLNGPED